MTLVPLIVGSIFLAVGINIICGFYKARTTGTKVTGRVKAIEKYISRTRSYDTEAGHSRTRVITLFRPIVDYVYNGENHTVKGIGVNEIRHKLGQNVPVLLTKNQHGDISARLDDAHYYLMGGLFAALGLLALGVYLFAADGSWIVMTAVTPATIAIGYLISVYARNYKSDEESTPEEDVPADPDSKSTIIDTKAAYREEVSAHGFWGMIIALAFMAISLVIVYFGYTDLPEAATDILWNAPQDFWTDLTEGTLPSAWHGPLILTGFGALMFLASLRSVYYVHKKYGHLMRM